MGATSKRAVRTPIVRRDVCVIAWSPRAELYLDMLGELLKTDVVFRLRSVSISVCLVR